jgi:hypothetical protein
MAGLLAGALPDVNAVNLIEEDSGENDKVE